MSDSVFSSLLFFLIQPRMSPQNSTKMERYNVIFLLSNVKERDRTQSPSGNKSDTPGKKMTGRPFLRRTNATLEFVGSSNSVKQKRLLHPLQFLGAAKVYTLSL